MLLANGSNSILADAEVSNSVEPGWFDPDWWQQRAAIRAELGGRGQALWVDAPAGALVLRRFQRGGFIARLVQDRYLWQGRNRSRAFREFRVLKGLHEQGLPVPRPVAAWVERRGLFYRAGLLTRLIPDARELAALAAELSVDQWRQLAGTLDAFFAAGLRHPDLNARNLLMDPNGRWFLLDLDRATLVAGQVDGQRMRRRLARSLDKLAAPGWRRGFEQTLGKAL
ncbi:MAG: 3-deoxy-D-manno-octulosonic acid kinase [Wenzhouxiangella sp.]|nr:3-deoxy-D-manno-octulosonic acid kinase [Wenzhouxiangella sp.]